MAVVAQTVLGPVPIEELGHTLMHEHLLCDLSGPLTVDGLQLRGGDFAAKTGMELSASFQARMDEPVTLANHYWVKRHVFNRDNLRLVDESVAAKELSSYASEGGGTLVDSTSVGLGRDPDALARLSRRTGVNVVMGSGFYTQDFYPSWLADATVQTITDAMINEWENGVGTSGIKPGIIGEIGLSDPVGAGENKVLKAAVATQKIVGSALQIHPGRSKRAAFQAVKLAKNFGADLSKTIVCHVDRGFLGHDDLNELARHGVSLEFDLFGQETSYYAHADVDRPNDVSRVEMIASLCDSGYDSQVIMSQDVCMKVYLETYGGPGYAHIIKHIHPLMRKKGYDDLLIQRISVENPKRLLSISK